MNRELCKRAHAIKTRILTTRSPTGATPGAPAWAGLRAGVGWRGWPLCSPVLDDLLRRIPDRFAASAVGAYMAGIPRRPRRILGWIMELFPRLDEVYSP